MEKKLKGKINLGISLGTLKIKIIMKILDKLLESAEKTLGTDMTALKDGYAFFVSQTVWRELFVNFLSRLKVSSEDCKYVTGLSYKDYRVYVVPEFEGDNIYFGSKYAIEAEKVYISD